jgi:circadian clock protein KaiC
MIERLPTGAPGLDEILDQGLPANAINLILGLPGSGKTLLAHQLVFRNATEKRPAVYVSTVSEPFEKVIRYGQELSFFDSDAVGRRVFYEDLGHDLVEYGLDNALERLDQLLNAYEPGVLVMDSFKPLASFAKSDSDYRRFVHRLAGRLSARPLTSLWVGEYTATELASAPEFAIADAVIWLVAARHEEREIRLLQVLKLRGSTYLSGRHGYRLSADGLRVFPRLADPGKATTYEFARGSVSTGVSSLDSMLGEGYRPGSATLVAGPSGIGKTVLGLHFICAGSGEGETSIFATLEENPSQIARAAASFGWSLDGSRVRLMYRSTVDLYVDEWVSDLLELMDSSEAGRVFIDGLGQLRAASPDPLRFREYLYSLVQRCSRQGVNLMMSVETPELFGLTRMSEIALSHLVDNVVLLQFVRRDGEYRRAMAITKSRAVRTDPRLREYTITSSGLSLVQDVRERHPR